MNNDGVVIQLPWGRHGDLPLGVYVMEQEITLGYIFFSLGTL